MTHHSDHELDRALRWVRGEMNPAEMAGFAEELRQNAELRETVHVMEALDDADAFATADHPSPAELAEYEASEGSLPGNPTRSAEIRNHLARCGRCRDDIALAADARQAPVTSPTVVRLAPNRW